MGIERPDFVGDGAVAEMPAAAEAIPRDEGGKIVRVDWSGGPPPPAPDADFEPPSDPNAEGRAIVAEVSGDAEAPGSFDALHPNVQALVRDQAGYDQTLASIERVKADLGDTVEAAESDFEELPVDAQQVVYALLSHDWTGHPEALADAYDQLSDTLPLTSDAELRQFLVDYGFIEG